MVEEDSIFFPTFCIMCRSRGCWDEVRSANMKFRLVNALLKAFKSETHHITGVEDAGIHTALWNVTWLINTTVSHVENNSPGYGR